MDFDYATESKNFDRALARAYNEDLEPGCEVDVMGRSHEPFKSCFNETFDQRPGRDTYCKMQAIMDLEVQKEDHEWLPSMLEHFWQNGIGSKGVEYLRPTGFIHSYE